MIRVQTSPCGASRKSGAPIAENDNGPDHQQQRASPQQSVRMASKSHWDKRPSKVGAHFDLNEAVEEGIDHILFDSIEQGVFAAPKRFGGRYANDVVESHFEPAMRHLIDPVAEVEEYVSREQADAQRDLNNALAQAGLDDAINLEHRHIAAGPPHLMIQEAVKKFSTDLVVMGTQARHGIPGLLIGNTAERVFSHLTCSVLAVKPDAFQCPIEFPES